MVEQNFAYGIIPLYDWLSHAIQLSCSHPMLWSVTPILRLVWAHPLSLAATYGIDFLSFPSGTKMFQFPELSSYRLCIGLWMMCFFSHRVPPFGYPRIVVYLRLPEAFRSLLRPSSALYAKAFTVRPFSFNHPCHQIEIFDGLLFLFSRTVVLQSVFSISCTI